MTQIWADTVVVLLVGASAALAMWAVLRVRDVTALHNGLVAALRDHGVPARAALAMTRVHAGVRAPDGTPISAAVFDRTIGLFAEALAEGGIPKVAIDAIAATVDPPPPLPSLRAAIVVDA